MKRDNVQRILNKILYGNYYWSKGDELILTEDNIILDHSTPMAKIEEKFDEDTGCYNNFLVVTLQNYTSQSTWKRHKDALIKEALENHIYVIFVPQIDIGFGVNNLFGYLNIDNTCDELIKAAKYCQTPIRSATAMTYVDMIDPVFENEYITGIAIPQYNENGEIVPPEEILYLYQGLSENNNLVCLIEPDKRGLEVIIDKGNTKSITWFAKHRPNKPEEHLALLDSLYCKLVKRRYIYIDVKPVQKFYNKEKV